MKAQAGAAFLLLLLLAACEGRSDPPPSEGATTPAYERVKNSASSLGEAETPVRIGELGPNFPACYAMARFRDRVVADARPVPVRAAPFEQARETGRVGADGQFFICTRSHDQRWFAIVWDEAAGASPACGVSLPVAARRDYDGPCRSGWVQSSLVRLESGIRHEAPPQQNSNH
ncbi:hypothetical protein [Allosphingosinicella sp.]|jgi:hypothetical protein|uniref:hypothetical protein n=1 Tax=Allosphingosinicella sp. TaxID=2823234 RepID=UPI002EEE9EB1